MTFVQLARVYGAGAATATEGSDLARILSVMAAEANAIAVETDVGVRTTVPLAIPDVPERLPEAGDLYDEYLESGSMTPWAAWVNRRRVRARFGAPGVSEVTVTFRLLLAAPDDVLTEGIGHLTEAERDVLARVLAPPEVSG